MDFDNDGDLDLCFQLANGGVVLLVNHGDGALSSWTGGPSSLHAAGGDYSTPSWADFDNDGWLDLLIPRGNRLWLFRNLSDGNFAEVTTGSVVKDTKGGKCGAWADYDNNGTLDLFVATDSRKRAWEGRLRF